jgi:hypothetical protein
MQEYVEYIRRLSTETTVLVICFYDLLREKVQSVVKLYPILAACGLAVCRQYCGM